MRSFRNARRGGAKREAANSVVHALAATLGLVCPAPRVQAN